MTVIIPGGIPTDIRRASEPKATLTTESLAKLKVAPGLLPQDNVAIQAQAATVSAASELSSATEASAQQNLAAAASVLTEADFDITEDVRPPVAKVESQPKQAVAAQTNKLPPKLLDLLSE